MATDAIARDAAPSTEAVSDRDGRQMSVKRLTAQQGLATTTLYLQFLLAHWHVTRPQRTD